jgi:hypothetical protein
MKEIRNFVDPVDKASAARLTQQLAEFEGNVAAYGVEVLAASKLSMVGLNLLSASQTLKPGQAAGFNTAPGNITVAIAAPRPGDACRFIAVIKHAAANLLVLAPAAGVTVQGVSHYTLSSLGLALLFCDGNNYWLV